MRVVPKTCSALPFLLSPPVIWRQMCPHFSHHDEASCAHEALCTNCEGEESAASRNAHWITTRASYADGWCLKWSSVATLVLDRRLLTKELQREAFAILQYDDRRCSCRGAANAASALSARDMLLFASGTRGSHSPLDWPARVSPALVSHVLLLLKCSGPTLAGMSTSDQHL